MNDITHSCIRFALVGAALAVSLAVSAGAQAWDSRTQFYSPGGAYLGEARTRNNPGIDASIPLQVRPMDPNAFSNGFARGLELRQLQDEIEADRGYGMADEILDKALAVDRARGAHEAAPGYGMADKLRRVEEEARAVDRAREALWARLRASRPAPIARIP